MKLYVGQSSDRGSIKRYGLDLLEMSVSDSMPKPKTLREMRGLKPNLKFALRLHPDVAQIGAAHPDMARATAAAEALEAEVIVVTSGPRFTPTERNQKTLSEMSTALRSEGRHVAWEPRGVWAAKEAEQIAQAHQMLLVRDLSREAAPAGATVYTRLLPFGLGARVSQNSLERLAGQLESSEVAYVVVQAQGAKMTRATLREWFELEES
jgi:hypothetical protein